MSESCGPDGRVGRRESVRPVLVSGVFESGVLASGVFANGVFESGVLASGVLASGVDATGGVAATICPGVTDESGTSEAPAGTCGGFEVLEGSVVARSTTDASTGALPPMSTLTATVAGCDVSEPSEPVNANESSPKNPSAGWYATFAEHVLPSQLTGPVGPRVP